MMPRRDGTGPTGAGAMTGRGMGFCTGAGNAKYGIGRGPGFGPGCRRGYKRGFGGYAPVAGQASVQDEKELLKGQRDALKNRLDIIDKRLENL